MNDKIICQLLKELDMSLSEMNKEYGDIGIIELRRHLSIRVMIKQRTKEMCSSSEKAREWMMRTGIYNIDGTLKDDYK